MTYGYLTKNTRISLGLEKSHVNDAFCIAGNLSAKPLETVLRQKKVRRNNRQMFKANTLKGCVRKRNQAPYAVKGFRLFDRVLYNGQSCFVTGRRASGYFALRTLDGTVVHNSAKAADITLLEMRKGYIQELPKDDERRRRWTSFQSL